MKAFAVAAAITLALFLQPAFLQPALAKVFPIPDENPIATVELPDNWDMDDLDEGIEATTKDESVYVSVEAADLLDQAGAIAAAFRFFDEKGIVIDKDSQKQNEYESNGLKVFELSFRGRDEDGPTNVRLSVVALSETRALLVTWWASDEGDRANADSLLNLVSSIQTPK